MLGNTAVMGRHHDISADGDLDARLWRIEQIERIQQLKARYFRAVDSKDWPLLESVFTSDAVLEVAGNVRTGRDEIIRVMSSRLTDLTTVHHGHMPEITILDDRTATGIWAMEDLLSGPDGTRRGYGHYHEQYRLRSGAWRIEHLRLVRIEVPRP